MLSAAAVAVALVNHQGVAGFLDDNEANSWVAGLAFGLVGALLLRDARTNRLGPLMSAGGVLAAVAALGYEVAASPDRPLVAAGAWAGSVLWLPALLGSARRSVPRSGSPGRSTPTRRCRRRSARPSYPPAAVRRSRPRRRGGARLLGR